MGFLDKAKAAANELAAKADTALASSGLGGPGGASGGDADAYLRDLGVITYLELSGRPVPPGERDRVLGALRSLDERGAIRSWALHTAVPPAPGSAGGAGFPPPPGAASAPPPPGGASAPPPPGAGAPQPGPSTPPPPPPGPHGTPSPTGGGGAPTPPPAPDAPSAPAGHAAPPPPPSWASSDG